jgi:hypothetical protein
MLTRTVVRQTVSKPTAAIVRTPATRGMANKHTEREEKAFKTSVVAMSAAGAVTFGLTAALVCCSPFILPSSFSLVF